MKYALLALIIFCGGLSLYTAILKRRLEVLARMLEGERTRQRSLSAAYGRITEQWFPLMDGYPYDSARFRFLGTPVDGVQFEEDKIIFVEFKSHRAELSAEQRRLKKLVEQGRVSWEEFVFQDTDPPRRILSET
jgi:predicted Holliday junction resolvase-like endonuclease